MKLLTWQTKGRIEDADFYRLGVPGTDASGRGRLRRASNLTSEAAVSRLYKWLSLGCRSLSGVVKWLSNRCMGPYEKNAKTRLNWAGCMHASGIPHTKD